MLYVSFTASVAQSLVGVSLVLTRLDHCNAVLVGLPTYQLDRLQSAINAAARMIYRTSRYDHVTSPLKELHWLRVPERIEFKLCALVNGSWQAYIADSLQPVRDVQSCRRLRSSSSLTLVVPVIRRATLGDRSFSVAATRAWNALSPVQTGDTEIGYYSRRCGRGFTAYFVTAVPNVASFSAALKTLSVLTFILTMITHVTLTV